MIHEIVVHRLSFIKFRLDRKRKSVNLDDNPVPLTVVILSVKHKVVHKVHIVTVRQLKNMLVSITLVDSERYPRVLTLFHSVTVLPYMYRVVRLVVISLWKDVYWKCNRFTVL